MVQSIDNSLVKPNYSAVKINISKPEVNAGGDINSISDDNGNYSAVNINIDNPTVNTAPKKIYDYPEAQGPVTYEMANIHPVPLPHGFNLAYHTTNVILPKIEHEVEIETSEPQNVEAEEIAIDKENENKTDEAAESTAAVVPEPNYTTLEEEKGIVPDKEEDNTTDNVKNDLAIKEEETKPVEIKKPEIIPGEEIMPEVDIPLVISNLTSNDYDVQAQQMEEIARISLDNSENAVPYIVREVFTSLIDISNKDTSDLAAPSDAQVQARKKLMANFAAMENAKDSNAETKLPYELSENDFILANELSPMEQAERNKEYALYTISILSKIYTDEVEKQTGDVVPLTDLPGSAAIVDALRYNPNSGVKIAAIDALRHIQRPEYKEELSALYTLAQADSNPQVSLAAAKALENTNVQ